MARRYANDIEKANRLFITDLKRWCKRNEVDDCIIVYHGTATWLSLSLDGNKVTMLQETHKATPDDYERERINSEPCDIWLACDGAFYETLTDGYMPHRASLRNLFKRHNMSLEEENPFFYAVRRHDGKLENGNEDKTFAREREVGYQW